MKLLVTQTDTLFDYINNHRAFTPSQFRIDEYDLSGNISFSFIGSNYYFKIIKERGYNNSYFTNFSPGYRELVEVTSGSAINPTIFKYFNNWLDNLEREINAPNKWEKLNKDIKSFKLPNIPVGFDEHFNYQEYTEVHNNINSLKESIKNIGLSSEQFNIINDKLDFITEQAKTLKKFDWRSLFIGTIINIATNIIISPSTVNAFNNLISNFLTKLLL